MSSPDAQPRALHLALEGFGLVTHDEMGARRDALEHHTLQRRVGPLTDAQMDGSAVPQMFSPLPATV